MIRGLLAAFLVVVGIPVLGNTAAALCAGTTVVYESGDFVISFDLWEDPEDEVGEIRHRPTGKRLEVFSIHLGTDGKRGSWDLSITERHCRDPDDCTLEGEVDVVQAGTDGEPPKELRFIGLGKAMTAHLRSGFWPDGALPDDRFVLKPCRRR